jgi:hypothetical protein
MFQRLEVHRAGSAPATDFDVAGFVRPVGHFVQGQVGDPHQRIAQAGILGPGLFGQARAFGLLLGHQRPQAFEFCVVPARLGGSHILGRSILRSCGRFGSMDFCPTRFVHRQKRRRHRFQPATGKGRVKGSGIFADETDIVHGSGLMKAVAALMPDYPRL